MRPRLAVAVLALALLVTGCAARVGGTALAARSVHIDVTTTSAPPPTTTTASPTTTTAPPTTTAKKATTAPPPPIASAGNPNGHATIPAAAQPVDTSHPDHVIGTGTPASCTSAAVVAAVAAGGIITFNCGSAPVTIALTATAKVRNTASTVVIDGGGRVKIGRASCRERV